MTNKDFESFLDTTDEWISSRTGIRERHIVPRGENVPASQLGVKAAIIAMERAQVRPEEIDGIICATFTPDGLFPSTACRMQGALGCKNAFAFDVLAACAGFVFALTTAESYIRSGQAKTMLVVGSEVISKVLDWTDRGTCILFGDGAGAVVLQGTNDNESGILSSFLASDGTQGDILELPIWGEKRSISMKGNEVFKNAVRMMSDISIKTLAAAGWTIDTLDYFIPHQANKRIISSVGDQLKLPKEKVVINLDRYGNTSSASIPIALDEAWSAGKIKKGSNILFTSMGGGLAVGSAAVRF